MGYDIILPPYRAIVPNASLLAAHERLNWGYKWAEADKMLEVGTGEGVVIFILDTAGATQHPDLVSQQLEGGKYNRNFTNDKSPDDAHGHGHHCAGIAAAAMNEQGIRGIAPDAKLVFLKVLNDEGAGSYRWIAEAIRYAADMKIPGYRKVLSMSFGGPTPSTLTRNALAHAKNQGCISVAAAGNEGYQQGENRVGYPAAYDDLVLAVASVGQSGRPSSFSSGGPAVDIAAPGYRIYSTHKGKDYAYLSGTSMACPHVAGIVANIISAYPTLKTMEEVEGYLSEYAVDLWEEGFDERTGMGGAKLGVYVDNPPESETPNPEPEPEKTAEFRVDTEATFAKRNLYDPERYVTRYIQAHKVPVEVYFEIPARTGDLEIIALRREVVKVLNRFNTLHVSGTDKEMAMALQPLDGGKNMDLTDTLDCNYYELASVLFRELKTVFKRTKYKITAVRFDGLLCDE